MAGGQLSGSQVTVNLLNKGGQAGRWAGSQCGQSPGGSLPSALVVSEEIFLFTSQGGRLERTQTLGKVASGSYLAT